MKNLKDFSNFENINEAFRSNILRKMKLDTDTVKYIINMYGLNMSKVKDEDLIKINGEDVNKKKYKDDYIIFVSGEYTETNYEFNYKEPESDKNPREFKYYGLLYILRGADVKVVHGNNVWKGGKKPQTPKRYDISKTVIRRNLDAYAVYLKVGDDPVKNIRDKRREVKDNAFISRNSREESLNWKNNYYKDENTRRYAAELKKKLNFDQIFETAAQKLKAISRANTIALEFFKYYFKINNPKGDEIFKEVEKYDKITFSLKPYEEISITLKSDYVKSKTGLLMAIVKLSSEMLKSQNEFSSDRDLTKLKSITKLIEEITEPDTKEAETFINSAKWTDSEKLKDLNKASGIFDN